MPPTEGTQLVSAAPWQMYSSQWETAVALRSVYSSAQTRSCFHHSTSMGRSGTAERHTEPPWLPNNRCQGPALPCLPPVAAGVAACPDWSGQHQARKSGTSPSRPAGGMRGFRKQRGTGRKQAPGARPGEGASHPGFLGASSVPGVNRMTAGHLLRG